MKLPILNQPLKIVVRGRPYVATCTDIFDGGYGFYFDAVFGKRTRVKFKDGEQCQVPELGDGCLADYVSKSQKDPHKIRFLLLKWGQSKKTQAKLAA
jgi:hypothetical protein